MYGNGTGGSDVGGFNYTDEYFDGGNCSALPTSPSSVFNNDTGCYEDPVVVIVKNYWALGLVVFPILTLFGNVLVIISVCRERALQSVTNYFIVSLALADLLVALVVMPFAVYVLVNGKWGLPPFVCDFYIAMDVICSTSSIFNLVAISIDRYIAVTQPIKYAKHKNNRRVWLTIVLVWAISAAIGSPIVLGLNNTPDREPDLCVFYNSNFVIYSSLSSFYIPCIIMVFLYWNIFKALNLRARKAKAARRPQLSRDMKPGIIIENVAQTRRRLAETTLLATASLAPGSSSIIDEGPTNTGSGSQDDEEEGGSPGSDDCHIIHNDKSTDFILSTVMEETAMVATLATPSNLTADPNGNLGSRPQDIDLVTRVLNPNQTVSSISDKIGDKIPGKRRDSSAASSPITMTTASATTLTTTVTVTAAAATPTAVPQPLDRSSRTTQSLVKRSLSSMLRNGSEEDGSRCSKKEFKTTTEGSSRFTIYKVNKASRKKREKSSARKERKATKTLAIVLDTLKDKITTATSNYGSPVTPLNKLNTGNANTIVAPIDLVTNSIASCSKMNVVDESSNILYGVCSDENQCNELSTGDVEDISNIVEQDVRHFQFPNDPSIVLDSKMSPEQFAYVAALQPCQPKASELKGCIFPTRMQGKWLRSFHEEHYYKKLPNGEFVKRTWISYSPSQDKVYCIVCKQFGKEDAKSHQLARFGSDDWSHISFKLKSHESNSVHLESEIRRAMFVSNQRVVSTIFESSNRNVAENREIVRVIFESLIYLARQNIAFRGRDESWTSNNQGNFIELIKFISKYNPTLSSHLTKIQNSKKKNRLTFLSNLSQNNMLHVLGEMVRERILIKIKKSGVFSFIIDTTTDVSNIEQLSLVIRFINENEEVEERLVALETVSDARGIGMFNVLCNICQKYDIDWEKQLCAQSYDGASSMQGQYSGVRAYIQEKNPRAIYVWCFSHILNLVVVDTCDTSKTMRNFFGDLQSLIAFLRARKRTAVFLNHQKICYPEKRVCRMKNFSTTRWTSHGRALTVIFEKYKALTNTLKELSNSTERDTSSVATNLLSTISSFQFVTHLLLMKNIFKHTTPLSMYLQSLSLDFITALTMVDNCAKKLSELRNEQQLDVLLAEAKTFSLENELEEVWFPEKRVQRRKKMAGEKTNDEIVSNAKDNFKIQVYFTVLDQICTSITSRFEGSREILSDLSLLSVDRLIAASKGCPIPEDNFVYLDKWIPNVQIDQLKLEYSTFAYSFLKLKSNIEIEKLHEKVIISESDEDTSVDTDEGNNEENKTKMTVLNVLKLLNTFNLISAFPNMYMAYKFLCTIPATSVSSERTFSKLKLIKTRIRSTMVQKRLDSLMLLSCEKDVIINLDEAINKYANTSKLLQEALLYK